MNMNSKNQDHYDGDYNKRFQQSHYGGDYNKEISRATMVENITIDSSRATMEEIYNNRFIYVTNTFLGHYRGI